MLFSGDCYVDVSGRRSCVYLVAFGFRLVVVVVNCGVMQLVGLVW